MFLTIIALICAILILYNLFSVIGYYDEEDIEKLEKKIKEIEIIKAEIDKKHSGLDTEEYEIKRNSAEDDKIFRELDPDSQNNLNKILELDHNFSLYAFSEYCDFLFTKLFNASKTKEYIDVEQLINEKSLEKLKKIEQHERTIVNNQIHIKNINSDQNNNIYISVSITSSQMYKRSDGHGFTTQDYVSNFSIGRSSNIDNSLKWILLDFDKI